MAPPVYSDLKKSVKDLFEKFFDAGNVKFKYKTKTDSGFDLNCNGEHAYLIGTASGDLKVNYKSDKGISLSEKFETTNNTLTTELDFANTFMEGLKQAFNVIYEPPTGNTSVNVKNKFNSKCCNMNFDLKFTSMYPIVNTSCVFSLCKFNLLGGANLVLDTEKQTLRKDCLAVSYQTDDIAVCGEMVNRADFEASVFQRIKSDLQSGVILGWSQATQTARFALAGRYQIQPTASVKAKVDNHALTALSYSFDISEGVKISLSAEVDVKNLDNGGHKMGLCLDFDM